MPKFYFSFLLFFLVNSLHAQLGWMEGYVITNSADTIQGKIYWSPPGHRSAKISFKYPDTKEKVKFRPFTIRGYGIKGAFFESRIYDIHPSLSYGLGVFMEIMNDGETPVSVYEYWNTDYERGFLQIFLVKDNGTSFEINPLRFRKEMIEYFKDYPALAKDIEAKKYGRRDLLEIVERYNSWKNKEKKK